MSKCVIDINAFLMTLSYPGSCPYCHNPRQVMSNGARLIPPIGEITWWGIMPRYSHRRIGTISKCDECPVCGRTLNYPGKK